MVRCGKCSVIFNGNENIKRLRSDGAATQSSAAGRPAVGTASPAADRPKPSLARKPNSQEAKPDRIPPLKSAPPVKPEQPKPRKSKAERLWPEGRSGQRKAEEPTHPHVEYYLEPLDRPRPGRRLARYGSFFLIVLSVLMAGQYVYRERNDVLDYPLLHAWMRTACEYIGCEVGPRRDIDRIEIIQRNVYTPPDRPNILRITATLVNKAPFPQPYPLMQVSFTNLQGTVVATRRFRPDEYLSPKPQVSVLMAPGAATRVSIEIPDPGVDATAFEFAFF